MASLMMSKMMSVVESCAKCLCTCAFITSNKYMNYHQMGAIERISNVFWRIDLRRIEKKNKHKTAVRLHLVCSILSCHNVPITLEHFCCQVSSTFHLQFVVLFLLKIRMERQRKRIRMKIISDGEIMLEANEFCLPLSRELL